MTNRPINFNDPTGHWVDEGCGTGGTICDLPPVSTDLIAEDGGGGGGPCISCHLSEETPKPGDSEFSDWFSGQHGGCFLCHAGVANNSTMLTNSQLSTSYNNAVIAQAQGGVVIIVSIGGGFVVIDLYTALGLGASTCASNAQCTASIDDIFEGAANISDDAFVAIHPATPQIQASITSQGLNPVAAQSQFVYVTQMRYFRGQSLLTAAENAGVDPAKWLTQPVTLWEVQNTAANMQNLRPIYGAFGPAPQWVSSSPLYPLIQHSQIP